MKNKKYTDILLWTAAVISLALAVVTAVFGFTSEKTFSKVILILVAVLFLALTAMVAYLAYLDTFDGGFEERGGANVKTNYFLSVNGGKKRISPDELTFDTVNERLSVYISKTFGTPIAMWKNEIFAEEGVFGNEDAFKTLIAYKMLFDLQSHHSKRIWNMFFELSDGELENICICLARNGDDELAQKLTEMKRDGNEKLKESAIFLDENANYIQRRMVNYVKRKAELFDI